jgi:hypothetical protein
MEEIREIPGFPNYGISKDGPHEFRDLLISLTQRCEEAEA